MAVTTATTSTPTTSALGVVVQVRPTLGRPRKADVDSVVRLLVGGHATIVSYRDDAQPRYLVVRTDALGRSPMGPAFWADSSEFTVTGRISRRPRRIWQKNEPAEVRGCACSCCVHVAGFDDEG